MKREAFPRALYSRVHVLLLSKSITNLVSIFFLQLVQRSFKSFIKKVNKTNRIARSGFELLSADKNRMMMLLLIHIESYLSEMSDACSVLVHFLITLYNLISYTSWGLNSLVFSQNHSKSHMIDTCRLRIVPTSFPCSSKDEFKVVALENKRRRKVNESQSNKDHWCIDFTNFLEKGFNYGLPWQNVCERSIKRLTYAFSRYKMWQCATKLQKLCNYNYKFYS